MTWSYSTDMADPINYIRFKIGDTNASDPQLLDEEIALEIQDNPNKLVAASQCALAIAAKVARLYDKTIGPMSTKDSAVYDKYISLSQALLKSAKGKSSLPIGANLNYTAAFDVGIHDNKETSNTNIGKADLNNEVV